MSDLTVTVPDTTLVAVTPTELIPAQRQLIGWCQAKIHALGSELREQRQNLRQAKTMKWKHSGWVNAVSKTKKRMIYYTKIRLAAEHGYLVVPNFDVDVIAVRVKRQEPNYDRDQNVAECEVLAPGQGRYVDNKVIGYQDSEEYTDSQNQQRWRDWFVATDFNDDIDFPVSLVKPAIMQATERAMALNLFDRIGIVQKGKRSDPIIVGQIVDPFERYRRFNPKCVTFFIAWWLDTKDL